MHILLTIFPIIILISMLFLNILLFDNSMAGPNQLALLLASIIGAFIAHKQNTSFNKARESLLDITSLAMLNRSSLEH